jgi:hypothetical protein
MFLDAYNTVADGTVRITPEQASRFAKEIADDFNPLHDVGAKRFCVPGDLLFSLVLANYGVSRKMTFTFTGMVGEGVALKFPEAAGERFDITDEAGKAYLTVERAGEVSTDPALIEALARSYVAFSGHSFPHILVPLMAEHKAMINPERPLVIYESMSIELDRLDLAAPRLELSESTLAVNGKRGDARLRFRISAGGQTVGSGLKTLVLSGLREYDEAAVQQMVRQYDASKTAYRGRT